MNNNSVWHPFTQMKLADPPVFIQKASGTILFGADGKEYIDAISSWWVNIHGHSHPVIAARIAEQAQTLEQVIFAGFTHQPAMDLADSLIRVLPDHFAKVFFSDNGSTAVEVAIKMSLQYWYNSGITNKTKVIAFENAYHGDTFGAMSVGAKSTFNAAFQSHLFEVFHIPAPDGTNMDVIAQLIDEYTKDSSVASFIFEPLVQGSGGMLMHKPADLNKVLALFRQKNVLCIADEVMTGFGRTGKNFAINYLEEKPDIICLSKGITGGFMPLGVTVSTQKIFDAFYADELKKTFFHGHSYTANPLACAAANASLQLLLDPDCQERIERISKSHGAFAQQIADDNSVKDVRQCGTILALELRTNEDSSYFNAIRDHVYRYCISQGVLLRPLGNILYIMPPYCITRDELNKVYDAIKGVMNELKSKQENRPADSSEKKKHFSIQNEINKMESILTNIVSRPSVHAKWLNTLSMMENTGAKKIKNCEHPVFVSEIILKHSAEEARHAYYLKKQISKIEENACPTYEKKYLLAPQTSYYYLHVLDVKVSRYLKEKFHYSAEKLKYAAYLLVTYAIEVRADELYPVYQDTLTSSGSSVSVKSIIAEEKNHLQEMITQLREFSEDWEEMTNYAVKAENELFGMWISDLEKMIAVDYDLA